MNKTLDLDRDPRLARLAVFYESLAPDTLDRLGELYAP